jgi:hypothetical protein
MSQLLKCKTCLNGGCFILCMIKYQCSTNKNFEKLMWGFVFQNAHFIFKKNCIMKSGRHLDGTLGYHDNNNNNNVLIFTSCKACNHENY